jgi:hypothetical protein
LTIEHLFSNILPVCACLRPSLPPSPPIWPQSIQVWSGAAWPWFTIAILAACRAQMAQRPDLLMKTGQNAIEAAKNAAANNQCSMLSNGGRSDHSVPRRRCRPWRILTPVESTNSPAPMLTSQEPPILGCSCPLIRSRTRLVGGRNTTLRGRLLKCLTPA